VKTARAELPIPRRAPLRAWARHNGIGEATARRWADRQLDPLPTLKMSARLRLVDLDQAERWLARQNERHSIDVGELVDSIVEGLQKKGAPRGVSAPGARKDGLGDGDERNFATTTSSSPR
jgi:hypothetical protein